MTFQFPKMDITTYLTQLKNKIIKGNHKEKNRFFIIFEHFFSKCTFLKLWHFFLASWFSNQLNFSVLVQIYKICAFDEALFLLTIWIPMITKLFRVVTCFKELSSIYMHEISTEYSYGVTWQINYISLPTKDVLISH